MTSSIDDQQERHFIGSLLYDDDVLAHGNARSIDTNVPTNVPLPANVLPDTGSIGPTPNCNFWPEPPPPYSPCTMGAVAPPWATVGQQPIMMPPPPGMMSQPPPPQPPPLPPPVMPPHVANSYGQALTATAVTRTDFYQSPYGRILKPMMGSNGALENMQHHYHTMFHHHQQHLAPTQVDPRLYAATPSAASIYSTLESAGMVNLEQYQAAASLSPKSVQTVLKSASTNGEMHENLVTIKMSSSILPLAGKSYRDVASKKDRSLPASSVSNSSGETRNISATTATKEAYGSGKKMSAIYRVDNNQITANDKRTGTVSNCIANKDKKMVREEQVKQVNGVDKKTNVNNKRGGENEFQKITHKKNKGVKSVKGETLTVDEDGLTGNHLVDASSRFDVLQSLNAHGAVARSRNSGVSGRSTSSLDSNNDVCNKTAKIKARESYDNEEIIGCEEAVDSESRLDERKRNEHNFSELKTMNITAHQVLKKIIGHRELSAQSVDQTRVGRKQRNHAKKRYINVTDRINFIATLVFSIIKYCIYWIVDLLMDISLQLWDITVYSVATAYNSFIYNSQYYWCLYISKMRLFWENIRMFNAKRLWTNELNEIYEWGLSENIHLPTTGEEAMERILRCQGRDAYSVLGLRANCSDDEIKRYYKRQAVLVHPDKNCLCGADEAFKILTSAFEVIGTPEIRTKYNIANLHKNPMHKEMERLWQRLREKMDEARNSMYCDCGSKHSRIPVPGLRPSEARYCRKCKARHSAKHNDIWGETRFAGFFWIYYACLDGVVYDITQWASCSSNQLKHMKANSHTVQYRLVTASGPMGNGVGSGVSGGGGGSSLSKHDKPKNQDLDDARCLDRARPDPGADCPCAMSLRYGEPMGVSQQASYRPPERTPFGEDRPRRAGRRRKVR